MIEPYGLVLIGFATARWIDSLFLTAHRIREYREWRRAKEQVYRDAYIRRHIANPGDSTPVTLPGSAICPQCQWKTYNAAYQRYGCPRCGHKEHNMSEPEWVQGEVAEVSIRPEWMADKPKPEVLDAMNNFVIGEYDYPESSHGLQYYYGSFPSSGVRDPD